MSIVYIESNTTGFGHQLLLASSRYDDVVFLTRDPGRYAFLDSLAGVNVMRCDTTSIETLTSILRGIADIRFIASTSDAYIDIAARLSERFEKVSNGSGAVTRCRDKLQLQDVFWTSEVAYPRTLSIRDTADVAELTFPIIVKPRQGTGSIGVKLVHSIEAMPNADGDEMLCQEFIAGKEFSVESFTDEDGHHILGITRKFVTKPPFFLELGHVFPADLPADTAERIEQVVRRALDAVGYSFGPAHTEVKLRGDDIFIIEINARLAGGMIPRLIERSYAWSMPDLYIQSYLTGRCQFPKPAIRLFSSVMFVVPEKDRRYIGIDFPKDCVDVGLFRQQGVNAGKFDFSDRAGYVVSVARTEFSAVRKSVQQRHRATVLYAENAIVASDEDITKIVYDGQRLPLNRLKDSMLSIEKAHLLMLRSQSILDAQQFATLQQALLALEAKPSLIDDHPSGRGDYFDYEHYMIACCGLDVGGMVQTARSRNDINSTHLSFVTRQVLDGIGRSTILLADRLLARASENEAVLLPIYSQFQTAMPGTVGHYLTAQADIVLGTLNAISDAAERLQQSALGACAGAGTSFDTDTTMTSTLLGFSQGPLNSLSAITNKNEAVACLSLLCEMSSNINRLVCDFQLFSMREVGILSLPNAMYGGSSNMPQKRNPYLLEWLRCGHERNIGRLVTAVSSISHLPSGNSYQASRAALETLNDSAQQLAEMLTVMTYAIDGAQFSAEASLIALTRSNACATLAAEQLVREQHLSFREAHTQLAQAVQPHAKAADDTQSFAMHDLIDNVNAGLADGATVNMLRGGGGPAIANTRHAVEVLKDRLLSVTRDFCVRKNKIAHSRQLLDRQFRSAS